MERKYIEYKGYHVFEWVKVPKSIGRVPKEYQGQEACFIFVQEGEFGIHTPDELYEFKKDEGMLAKCFDFFMDMNYQKNTLGDHVDMVGVILNKEIVEELFKFDISNYDYQIDYNVLRMPIDALLENYKKSIIILLENPDLADDLMIATKIKEFVLLLTRKHHAPSEQNFLAGLLKSPTFDFEKIISSQLLSNLSLNEVAHLSNMSLSSFKRKFKAIYNESPKQYFLSKKLERAKQLLSNTNLRISEIAYDIGFQSLSSFNRNFRRYYGKSPTSFRLN